MPIMKNEVMTVRFLDHTLVIGKITAAVFVPAGSGAPVHKNRRTHGLAFNVDHGATYRFEDGSVLTCHAGECIYLPRGSNYTVDVDVHSAPARPGAGTYAINFLLTDEGIACAPSIWQVRGKDELLSAFTKAEKAWRQKTPGFYEECFIDLYRILKALKKERGSYSQLGRVLEKLDPALEYINANYTKENIPLARLAELCDVSEPYLRKLFHSAFSVSPAVYMRNMRLGYARELLQSGEYSITNVAALSGFNDITYFSREFKKATGVPPNQYVKGV